MTVPYLAIHGRFVIVGKEPDGDSVRFIADRPEHFGELGRGHFVKISVHDGSVQLRLDSVDAPELHYASVAQPLGVRARDDLLAKLGFTGVAYDPVKPTLVQTSVPEWIGGFILTHFVEENGRPVSYVLLEADAGASKDGDWVEVGDTLLEATLNCRLLADGLVYYMAYTSTPQDQRGHLRGVAASARSDRLGVWALDETRGFVLRDQRSIGPDGELILPKLFRRCTDYLERVAGGFRGSLSEWLVAVSGGFHEQNDRIVVGDGREVRLSDLIEQHSRYIAFQADLLDITFVEQ